MTETPDSTLHPEVLPASSRYWRHALVVSLGAAAGAGVGVVALGSPQHVQLAAPAMAIEAAPVEPVVAVAVAPVEPAPAVVTAPAEVMQVMTEGKTAWLLLDGRADRAWLGGKAVVSYVGADSMWVERAVALDEDAVPARLQAWRGRSVVVVDSNGNQCSASVGDVVGRQFGLSDGAAAVGTTVDSEYLTTSVVARLAVAESGCGEPLYALGNASDTRARFGSSENASAPVRRRARRAFRKLRAYKRIQARWTSDEFDGTGRWDAGDGVNDVRTIRLGGQQFVLVAAYGGSCGGPEGELVAMWRLDGDKLGDLVMQTSVSLTHVRAVLDADADGMPDLVIGQDLATATLLSDGGTYRALAGFDIDHDFCRC